MAELTETQRTKCHGIIHTASVAAGAVGAGLAQIPLSDAAVITPIQITMIMSLAGVFEISLAEGAAKSLIAGLGASYAGRAVSQVLLGWIPMLGNALNASTAAGITEALGWTAVEHFASERLASEIENRKRVAAKSDLIAQKEKDYAIEKLHDLCANGTLQEVEAALESDADIDIDERNSDDMTALMLAAANNPDSEVVAVLLENGADVNEKSRDGLTALMLAVGYNPNPEVISLLLKNGADVNEKVPGGVTALMLAARNNPNPEVISLLLENGADAQMKDDDGKRAIDHARENDKIKNTEAFKLLHKASRIAINR